MSAFRYKAFISYSWADASWGNWLHRVLETYRTPAALVGKPGTYGPVPARLHPLFKDREEQAAGASISASLDAALADSEFLIVLCSPRSAASQWVNHEIAWFKANRDPARILALIIDGEPPDCFPPALTHRVNADLSVTGTFEGNPLAADGRNSGDGARRAKLKLAAAMLGVGLDELVGRDDRRRALRLRAVVGGSLALALVMTALAVSAVRARDEADRQRSEADGLVEFMLTDLRDKLEPVGRLDALDVVGQRALKYYAGQRPGELDADALGRRSRALHLVGEVRNIRGDSAGGLTAFRQAAATTAELLARDPDNEQRIFDHAQSVFWVGYIAYERGEAKEAEAQFREYKRLADQLVGLNPKKPEWQMEASYAETNLGVLFYEQSRYAEAEGAFAMGVKLVEAVAARQNGDLGRKLEVGGAINWLAKARDALNRFDDAELLHRREIAIYQNVLKSDPANNQAKVRTSAAWQHISSLSSIKGDLSAAMAASQQSLAMMAQLRAIEPDNTEWQETETRARLGYADHLFYADQTDASAAMNAAATASIERLVATDQTNTIWSIDLKGWAQWQQARLLLAQGNANDALPKLQALAQRYAAAASSRNSDRMSFEQNVLIATGDALARLGRQPEAMAIWQAALDKLGADARDRPIRQMRSQYMLFKRLGRTQQAFAVVAMLDRQGDRSPAYLREKRAAR